MDALLVRVAEALGAPDDYATEQLDALNQETGREHCHRRNRILYQLQGFLHQNTPAMAAPSTTHRFKTDFNDPKAWSAPIEVNGQTKAVNATNLTDEDVPLLKQYGYGHFIEELPEPEKPAEPEDLHKLLKPALQAKYTEVVGEAPPEAMLRDDLIKAIEAKQKA